MLQNLKDLTAVPGGKRENPNYIQISGHVPKSLGLQFKAVCAANELTLSKALEDAVQKWLANQVETEGK
jgi:hypothetical protein